MSLLHEAAVGVEKCHLVGQKIHRLVLKLGRSELIVVSLFFDENQNRHRAHSLRMPAFCPACYPRFFAVSVHVVVTYIPGMSVHYGGLLMSCLYGSRGDPCLLHHPNTALFHL